MKEEEKLRAFLNNFYQHRGEHGHQPPLEGIPGLDYSDYARLFNALKDNNFLEGKITLMQGGVPIILGNITSKGIQAIEKNLPLDFSAAPVSQTINFGDIHNAQNIVAGNNNNVQQTFNQSVQVLIDQIEQSNGSPEEKAEAKSRLRHFLEHPLVAALASAALGAVL